MSFTRDELIENAYDCMAAEMQALPDDMARAAAFLRLVRDMSEWIDDNGITAMTSPERSAVSTHEVAGIAKSNPAGGHDDCG